MYSSSVAQYSNNSNHVNHVGNGSYSNSRESKQLTDSRREGDLSIYEREEIPYIVNCDCNQPQSHHQVRNEQKHDKNDTGKDEVLDLDKYDHHEEVQLNYNPGYNDNSNNQETHRSESLPEDHCIYDTNGLNDDN